MGDLLKADYRKGGEHALPPARVIQSLPFPAVSYLVKGNPLTPSWTSFVGGHFDVSGTRNVSSGFVMLFQAAKRSWALTFGTGFHAIDLRAVEPGFGLRVCANSLDPEAVRSMENRRVGAVTRQQRTHVSRGSRISELGVLLDQDWVRYLAGRSAAEDLAGTLAGSDALALTTDLPLPQLPSLCTKILKRFRSTDYRDGFAFIDQFRALRKGDALVDELDAEIERRIAQRDLSDLHLAPPQIPDDSRLAGYRVWSNRKHRDILELDLAALFEALDNLPSLDEHLDTLRIADVSDEGALGPRETLRLYLVAEFERSDKLYVHSLGSWFEIDKDYAASITRQVSSIEDATKALDLPVWEGRDEGQYNKDVAEEKGWVLLDAKPIHFGGRNQKVELCDLLTHNDDHICVKKAESSATLSHLFNQAAVICELYRSGDKEFLRKAEQKLKTLAPGRSFPDLTAPRFVYAIGTTKPGSLAKSLFFFSKLTLVAKATEIRSRGGRVAIARIQIR